LKQVSALLKRLLTFGIPFVHMSNLGRSRRNRMIDNKLSKHQQEELHAILEKHLAYSGKKIVVFNTTIDGLEHSIMKWFSQNV